MVTTYVIERFICNLPVAGSTRHVGEDYGKAKQTLLDDRAGDKFADYRLRAITELETR